jgi:enoyl-CoA hydratase
VTEPGQHVERALALAEALAAHPQATMRSDRAAVLRGEGLQLEDGLALEAALGRERLRDALAGGQAFARRNL